MKLIVTTMVVLGAWCSYGQKINTTDVPSSVTATFALKFPKAKNIKWSKENHDTFEAEFKIDSREHAALIDASGKWLETEISILKKDLPEPVLKTIAKEFSGFEIEEAEILENGTKATIYEVELEKGELTYDVQFQANGTMIKKEIAESSEHD